MTEITALLTGVAPIAVRAGMPLALDSGFALALAGLRPATPSPARQAPAAPGTILPDIAAPTDPEGTAEAASPVKAMMDTDPAAPHEALGEAISAAIPVGVTLPAMAMAEPPSDRPVPTHGEAAPVPARTIAPSALVGVPASPGNVADMQEAMPAPDGQARPAVPPESRPLAPRSSTSFGRILSMPLPSDAEELVLAPVEGAALAKVERPMSGKTTRPVSSPVEGPAPSEAVGPVATGANIAKTAPLPGDKQGNAAREPEPFVSPPIASARKDNDAASIPIKGGAGAGREDPAPMPPATVMPKRSNHAAGQGASVQPDAPRIPGPVGRAPEPAIRRSTARHGPADTAAGDAPASLAPIAGTAPPTRSSDAVGLDTELHVVAGLLRRAMPPAADRAGLPSEAALRVDRGPKADASPMPTETAHVAGRADAAARSPVSAAPGSPHRPGPAPAPAVPLPFADDAVLPARRIGERADPAMAAPLPAAPRAATPPIAPPSATDPAPATGTIVHISQPASAPLSVTTNAGGSRMRSSSVAEPVPALRMSPTAMAGSNSARGSGSAAARVAPVTSPAPAVVKVEVTPAASTTPIAEPAPARPALQGATPVTPQSLPAPAPPVPVPAAQAFAAALFTASTKAPAAASPHEVSASGGAPRFAGMQPAVFAATAPVALPAQPAIDTGRAQWLEAMIDRIELLAGGSDRRDARIRLSPDALGTVEVRIERDGDRMQIRFTAEAAATRTLLADAAPRLAELAEARGLKLQAGVDGGQGGGGSQPRRDESPAGARNPLNPHSAAASAEEAEADDRIA